MVEGMRHPAIRRGTARPTPRTVVHLAVADPDLAEDCRAAVTACGLTSQPVPLCPPPTGCAVLLVDGRAAQAAGDHATALALSGAGQAIVIASKLMWGLAKADLQAWRTVGGDQS